MYTGIVEVYLGYKSRDGVKVCGNGRIHRLSERGAGELRIRGPHVTDPEYCKYLKLQSTDRPTKGPETMTLEFEQSIHTNRRFYPYLKNLLPVDVTGLNQ